MCLRDFQRETDRGSPPVVWLKCFNMLDGSLIEITRLCLSFELKAHRLSCQLMSLPSSVLRFSRRPRISLMTPPIMDFSGVIFDL